MTGKLIKYEARSSIRLISIIWAALIVASVLLGLVIHVAGSVFTEEGPMHIMAKILSLVTPLLYGTIMIAMIVVTVLLVVLRFYRGLLSDEGYLMHTLPVKPWQLITAKGVVAGAVVLISGIVAFLSILILISFDNFGEVVKGFRALLQELGQNPRYILVGIEILILIVLSILKSVYQIYAAMAIGQLAEKFRALLSLGAYIAINMALTGILIALLTIGDATGLDVWLTRHLPQIDFIANEFALSQVGIGVLFVGVAVQLVAFHIITERLLSRKLNLL